MGGSGYLDETVLVTFFVDSQGQDPLIGDELDIFLNRLADQPAEGIVPEEDQGNFRQQYIQAVQLPDVYLLVAENLLVFVFCMQ